MSAAIQAPNPWHREALAQMQAQQQEGRLPHALLLSAAAGTGALQLAQSLVQWLLCERPRGGLACGECQGCHLSTSGTHPDLLRVAPAETGKAIRIDQVREVVEFSARTAQYSGYRVVLLEPAEAMNRASQNALLKTLEEPGAQTLLLLVSYRTSALLPTVLSRCQMRRLGTPDETLALEWLAPQVGGMTSAQALLTAAGGAPIKALALEQSDGFAARGKAVAVLHRVALGEISAVSAARQLNPSDVADWLASCHGWVHQALRQANGLPGVDDPQLRGPLAALAQVPQARLLAFAEALVRARRLHASGANPNKDLLLEQLMLVLAGIEQVAQL